MMRGLRLYCNGYSAPLHSISKCCMQKVQVLSQTPKVASALSGQAQSAVPCHEANLHGLLQIM